MPEANPAYRTAAANDGESALGQQRGGCALNSFLKWEGQGGKDANKQEPARVPAEE